MKSCFSSISLEGNCGCRRRREFRSPGTAAGALLMSVGAGIGWRVNGTEFSFAVPVILLPCYSTAGDIGLKTRAAYELLEPIDRGRRVLPDLDDIAIGIAHVTARLHAVGIGK